VVDTAAQVLVDVLKKGATTNDVAMTGMEARVDGFDSKIIDMRRVDEEKLKDFLLCHVIAS
jgi:hypothetical protein